MLQIGGGGESLKGYTGSLYILVFILIHILFILYQVFFKTTNKTIGDTYTDSTNPQTHRNKGEQSVGWSLYANIQYDKAVVHASSSSLELTNVQIRKKTKDIMFGQQIGHKGNQRNYW